MRRLSHRIHEVSVVFHAWTASITGGPCVKIIMCARSKRHVILSFGYCHRDCPSEVTLRISASSGIQQFNGKIAQSGRSEDACIVTDGVRKSLVFCLPPDFFRLICLIS